jgi:RNA polymerase sigma-70 factor, ECF subfamily
LTESVQTSFESLYSTHAPRVRRLLRDHGVTASDLDDVLQETFVTVHRLLPSFEGRSSFSTWLHAVTWRVAANHRRRQRRTVVRGGLDVAAEPSDEPSFERESYSLEHAAPSEQRDLIALHDIGGLSISWLAELTGYARATVRNKLLRGRAALMRAHQQRELRTETFERELAARFAQPTPIATAPDTRVLCDGLSAVTTIDDMVLALWRGPCTREPLHEVIGTLITHARSHPEGIVYLSVIEPTSTPPNREGRDTMLWASRQMKGKVKAVAHVAEGSVRLALIASVMNASILLARGNFDPHYFGELSPTLRWLQQFGPVDSQLVRTQLERMKRQLAPAPRS